MVHMDDNDEISNSVNDSKNSKDDAFSVLSEDQVSGVLQLFAEARCHNDIKKMSFNKFAQESLPRLLLDWPRIVVKHGPQWLRFTFEDVIMNKPVHMNQEGECSMLIPQKCLRDSQGYGTDVSVHIKYETFHMVCNDGAVKFPTIEEQKAEQAAIQAVVTNEGLNRFFQEAAQATQKNTAASSPAQVPSTIQVKREQQPVVKLENANASATTNNKALHNSTNRLVEQDPAYSAAAQLRQRQSEQAAQLLGSLTLAAASASAANDPMDQYGDDANAIFDARRQQAQQLSAPEPVSMTPAQTRQFVQENTLKQAEGSNEASRLNSLKTIMSDDEQIKRYGHLLTCTTHKYVRLFEMPVMVKSCMDHMVDVGGTKYGECQFDEGGHFIANTGSEKILMFREGMRYNIIMIFLKKDANYLFYAQCRSEHKNMYRSTSTLDMYYMNKASNSVEGSPILVHQSANLDNIPLVILLRALGIEKAADIRLLYRFVNGPDKCTPFQMDVLERCIEDDRGCSTTREAILRMGKLLNAKTTDEQEVLGLTKLRNDILPHLNSDRPELEEFMKEDFFCKAMFLCRMASRLIEAVEHSSQYPVAKDNPYLTDKDSYFTKRMETSDELLSPLIRQYLNANINTIVKPAIQKLIRQNKPVDVYAVFDMDKITKGINSNIGTGTWHAQAGIKSNTGVSQNVERYNFMAQLAQHRKIINHIHKEGKHIDPRLLPETGYGTICSVDSPEGPQCGLVRNEAILNRVSLGSEPDAIIQLLYNSGLVKPYHKVPIAEFVQRSFEHWELRQLAPQGTQMRTNESQAPPGKLAQLVNPSQTNPTCAPLFVHVYANHKPIGIAMDGIAVMEFVRSKRRKLTISGETGTSRELQGHAIEIRTEAGRNGRDMFVVENLHKLKQMDLKSVNWRLLQLEQIVEYIDKDEEREVLIASTAEDLNEAAALAAAPAGHQGDIGNEQSGQTKQQAGAAKEAPQIASATASAATYTHAEMHGCVIYGVCANMIPFPNCNPPARNTFQSHMGRAAQGQPSTNAKQRLDNSFTELWYAERPLVNPEWADLMGSFRLPAGHNLNIMIMAAKDHSNEEDSVTICQDIVDAGWLCSSIYKTMLISEKRFGKGNKKETFALVPPEFCAGYKLSCDYSKLDSNGIIKEGSIVKSDTILAQKVIPRSSAGGSAGGAKAKKTAAAAAAKKKTASAVASANGVEDNVPGDQQAQHDIPFTCNGIVNSNSETGIADTAYLFNNEQTNSTNAKIRVRYPRISQEGDKYSTRHGQKGTGAAFLPKEDLPYDPLNGECPDLIMNGLAFSSRMTFGQYIAMLLGLISALNGRFGNATPFSKKYRDALYCTVRERNQHFIDKNHPLEEMGDALRALGLHPQGSRSMIDGESGERLACTVYMCPEFTQKLKHMVVDKARGRGRGKLTALARPTPEGRKINYGLKIGEMEKDCILGSGASAFGRDRLLYSADPSYVHLCKFCNLTTIYHEGADLTYCKNCNKKNSSTNCFAPATFFLFENEAEAVGLKIKKHTEQLQSVK